MLNEFLQDKPLAPATFPMLRQGRVRSVLEAVIVLAMLLGALLIRDLLDASWGPVTIVFLTGVAVLAPIGLIAALGRSWSGIGLSLHRLGPNLGFGLLMTIPAYVVTAAFAMILVLISAAWDGHSLRTMFEAKQPMMEAVSTVNPLMVLPVALFVGFYEETVFRGFLLGRLAVATGSVRGGVVGTSLLFGLLHYTSQGWLGFVQTTVLGAVLATMTVWRKSLWPAIACHAGIDTVGIALVLWLAPMLKRLAATLPP